MNREPRFELTHVYDYHSDQKKPLAVAVCRGEIEVKGLDYLTTPFPKDVDMYRRLEVPMCKNHKCLVDYRDLPFMGKKKSVCKKTPIMDIFYIHDLKKNISNIPCGNHCIHDLIENNLIRNIDMEQFREIKRIIRYTSCAICELPSKECKACWRCEKRHRDVEVMLKCQFNVPSIPDMYIVRQDEGDYINKWNTLEGMCKLKRLHELKHNIIINSYLKSKSNYGMTEYDLGILILIANDMNRIRKIDENITRGRIGMTEKAYLANGWVHDITHEEN